MGYHLVGEVLGFAPDLPYRDFRVLVALALDATDGTRLAMPGYELLALHGNCSMRTVERTVGRLVARGYLEVHVRPAPPHRRAVYAILPMPGTPDSEVASERRPLTVADERPPLTVADERPPITVAGEHRQPEKRQRPPLESPTPATTVADERPPITVAAPEPTTRTLDLNLNRSSLMTAPGTTGQPGADRRRRGDGLSESPGSDRISRSDDDPREILRRFGATEAEADAGLRLIAALTADPAGYLRGKSGDPAAVMRWLRRQLDGSTSAESTEEKPRHDDRRT